MITRITIPQGFENMEEATIGAWLKTEGDTVATGDALCELITEKTTFELPAEGEGVLRRIVAAEKSVVPVGYVIGLIGAADESLPEVNAANAALLARRQEAKPEASGGAAPALRVPSLQAPGAAPPAPAGGSRVRATPAARRAARERGLDLEAIAAAFPGKVLSEEDVAKFQG